MADQMHRARRAPNDGFNRLSLVGDIGIPDGAALGRTAVSEQTRRHTPKSVLPMSHDRPPGGAGAAGSRHQHDRRTLSRLVIVDASAHVFDHGAKVSQDENAVSA